MESSVDGQKLAGLMQGASGQIRVLHVLRSGQIGGIERIVHDLSAEQLAQGSVHPGVLFTSGTGPFVAAIRALGVEVSEAGMSSGFVAGPRAIKQVLRAASQVDVVHLHGFSPATAFPLVLSNRPIVFSEHGVFGQGRRATLADHARQWLKGHFLRRCVTVVAANSEFTARQAAARYRLNPSELEVVHNGIRVTQFQSTLSGGRHEHFSENRPLVVGSVGRLVGCKRFDRLLRGVALAGADKVRVLIVGGGPDREALLQLAQELHIDSLVEFTGPVTDVPRQLAAMDLFVLPSQDETFGLALAEAIAAGLPAIVFSDSGGPVEILRQLGCGLVVDDEMALANAIGHAARSGLLPSTCSPKQIGDVFGIAIMADHFLDLYRKAIQRSGAP